MQFSWRSHSLQIPLEWRPCIGRCKKHHPMETLHFVQTNCYADKCRAASFLLMFVVEHLEKLLEIHGNSSVKLGVPRKAVAIIICESHTQRAKRSDKGAILESGGFGGFQDSKEVSQRPLV
jgi:hypothetical protein